MPRRKALTDHPCLTTTEAADIFGWCRIVFLRKFAEVLHQDIRFIRTTTGRAFLLVDVIRAAYPEANNEAVHFLAADVVRRKMEKRAEKRRGRKQNETI